MPNSHRPLIVEPDVLVLVDVASPQYEDARRDLVRFAELGIDLDER